MTNAEAIEILKRLQDPEPWEPQLNYAAYNALNMAISALEKKSQKKPLTHADRIRAMTDEELAYVVMCQDGQCPDGLTCEETNCIKCTLDWLKREVSE